jgi:carbamoyl-phosphate synthase large subunit
MDPWFLHQLREVVLAQMAISGTTPETIGTEQLRQLKRFNLVLFLFVYCRLISFC